MKDRIELLMKLGISEEHAIAFCKGIWIDAQLDNFADRTAAEDRFYEQIPL